MEYADESSRKSVIWFACECQGVMFQINTQPAFSLGVRVPGRDIYTGFHRLKDCGAVFDDYIPDLLSLYHILLAVWFFEVKYIEIYKHTHPECHGWTDDRLRDHPHLIQ